MKDRRWRCTWRPHGFGPHVSLRQTNGQNGDPVGLGVRFFAWRYEPGWTYNVDLLLGPWDLQVGVHWWSA